MHLAYNLFEEVYLKTTTVCNSYKIISLPVIRTQAKMTGLMRNEGDPHLLMFYSCKRPSCNKPT